MTELECARCGEFFPLGQDHTELVRRDFVGIPQPSQVEHLCRECWRAYVEDFLDEEFELPGRFEEGSESRIGVDGE